MAPFTADYRANFSDTDAAGIVHFSTIFFWVEATEEALFRHLKLPFCLLYTSPSPRDS